MRSPHAYCTSTVQAAIPNHHHLAERALALLRRRHPLDALSQDFTAEAAFQTLLQTRSRRTLALSFLSWAQPQPFFRSSLRLHCAALHLLSTFRRFDLAKSLAHSAIKLPASDPKASIFQLLRETHLLCGKHGSSAAFDLLVKSYSSLRMVSEAMAALNLTKSIGLAPGILAYNSILDAMFRTKKSSSEIQSFYREMRESSVSLNVFSYNILIRGFCSYGDLDRGLGFLQEMEREGCLPNVVTFNTLVDAHCKLQCGSSWVVLGGKNERDPDDGGRDGQRRSLP